MAGGPLSLRQLNRALLARQHLLDRTRSSVSAVLERLVGLQAQDPLDPYIGLYNRIRGFDGLAAGAMVERRELVRITLMRGTIHIVTRRDAHALRPLLEPVLGRVVEGRRTAIGGADPAAVAAAGKQILEGEPLGPSELHARLSKRWPGAEPLALARIVQARVPLIQTPPRGVWGKSGRARLSPLGRAPPGAKSLTLDEFVVRYLKAFGPASVQDTQAWCGLTKLSAVFARLGESLDRFEAPDGAALFDLSGAPRPPADTPAPPRFLPIYENAVLGFRDRARIIRPGTAFPKFHENASIRFALVDGSFAATWNLERSKATATLVVRPFVKLLRTAREELEEEGGKLLEFLVPDAEARSVRVHGA